MFILKVLINLLFLVISVISANILFKSKKNEVINVFKTINIIIILNIINDTIIYFVDYQSIYILIKSCLFLLLIYLLFKVWSVRYRQSNLSYQYFLNGLIIITLLINILKLFNIYSAIILNVLISVIYLICGFVIMVLYFQLSHENNDLIFSYVPSIFGIMVLVNILGLFIINDYLIIILNVSYLLILVIGNRLFEKEK